MIKSLWASVMGNPKLMQHLNGGLTIFWIAMIPLSIYLGLLSSVQYVSALSLWALVSGHWSAWQAARVEVHQDEDANVQQVIDKLDGLASRFDSFETVQQRLREIDDTP